MWQIDKFSRVPIYEQVVDLVERFVQQGILQENELLPSVRTLSLTMGVNPNTLQKAYMELERRGICRSVPGSGRYVSAGARERLLRKNRERLGDLRTLAASLLESGVSADEMVECIRSLQAERMGK